MKLTKRLNTIVNLCDDADCIIDVGTDHGYVAISLANQNRSNIIIASDISKGPLSRCKYNAMKFLDSSYNIIDIDDNNNVYGKKKFFLSLSDGLSKLDKKVLSGIIIAGMGFDTICDVLKDVQKYNYKYLVICSHTKQNELLKFLVLKKIYIEKIVTVYEDDKCYFIFKCLKN